ncbi:MAG: CBS domain-containing protein [Planctomycetota bacterium]|nr:CBS domain-containing protein [Planctomycetota bacterium]
MGEAIGILVARRFRSVPVVDDAGKMIGQFGVHALLRMMVPRIATERLGLPHLPFVQDDLEDLRRRLRRFWDKPVGEYAERDYFVVHPDTPLTKTVLSLYHTHDNLPVVDRKTGQLLGIISYWDIVQRLLN